MEVIYRGPRSQLNDFLEQVTAVSGATQFTLDYLKKGWVADEVIRTVIQFDLDDAHTAREVVEHLMRLVKGKVYSAVVRTNGDEVGPDGNSDDLDT